MAFEDLKAEIAFLMQEMVNQPDDAREAHEHIRARLIEMRGFGLPLPADLVELESRLDADFSTPVEATSDPA